MRGEWEPEQVEWVEWVVSCDAERGSYIGIEDFETLGGR